MPWGRERVTEWSGPQRGRGCIRIYTSAQRIWRFCCRWRNVESIWNRLSSFDVLGRVEKEGHRDNYIWVALHREERLLGEAVRLFWVFNFPGALLSRASELKVGGLRVAR